MSEYEQTLVALVRAAAEFRDAAVAASLASKRIEGDGNEAQQALVLCRQLLGQAQVAAPGLRDVYVIPVR